MMHDNPGRRWQTAVNFIQSEWKHRNIMIIFASRHGCFFLFFSMQILSNRRLSNGTKASPIFFTGKKKNAPTSRSRFWETDSINIWVDCYLWSVSAGALFGRGCSSLVRKMIYTPGNFHSSNMESYISVQQTKKNEASGRSEDHCFVLLH